MTVEDEAKLALLRETLEANVDFTTYETEVYLALVRGGTQTMTEIGETSGVPKQRVYDIVDNLQNRGFVEVIDDYPQKAYAVDPTEALSSIRDRLSEAEEYLEELHDTVETVESGVALFKSQSTIQRYISDLLQTASRDVLLLLPSERLPLVADELDGCTDQQVRLILSNVPPEVQSVSELDGTIPDTVDEVRAVSTREDFALSIDRRRGLYWVQEGRGYDDSEGQGYYVTNPSLAMVIDRFVSESVWPLARPLGGGPQKPDLPKHYMRIRDCLSDISILTERHPVDSFEITFEGYDTETGENVTRQGTLTGYYYTEYDMRTSLTVSVDAPTDDVESSLVTVGGVGTRDVDYAAYSIEVSQNGSSATDELDDETKRHLSACRAELPAEFGNASVVTCFDAFIDRMREFIEREPGSVYEPIRKFDTFRETLGRFEASETAPRIEWRQTRTEPGGIVAHVGSVFDALDYDVTLIGQLGDPIRSEFARNFRSQTMVSVGQPMTTDYVWFDDRKFLLTEPSIDPLTWEQITDRIDLSSLAEYVDGTAVVNIGTWYAIPDFPEILDGLREDLWPLLNSPPSHVHLHLGDTRHLSVEEVERGCRAIDALDDVVPVTLTTNRNQTRMFRDMLVDTGDQRRPTVEQVRRQFGVTRYVMHTSRGATLASPDDVVSAKAPQVVNPSQSQNVDEHFISGMAIGLAEDLSDGAALVVANAVASYFRGHEKAPTASELRTLISDYDAFFESPAE